MSTISAAPFEIKWLDHDETIEVWLSGELDLAAVPELWSALAPVVEARKGALRRVILNLEALQFLDASGLGVIVRLANRLRSIGGAISIRSPQPLVRRVLTLTDVSGLLPVESDPR